MQATCTSRHYEPSIILQGKTPWKDPKGSLKLCGVFLSHFILTWKNQKNLSKSVCTLLVFRFFVHFRLSWVSVIHKYLFFFVKSQWSLLDFWQFFCWHHVIYQQVCITRLSFLLEAGQILERSQQIQIL